MSPTATPAPRTPNNGASTTAGRSARGSQRRTVAAEFVTNRRGARASLVAPWPFISLAGIGIGLLMGFFGVGGSSVATPTLSLLGVPGLAAVASPLPATIPSAMLGAYPYLRSGEARPKAAGWSLLGAVPATIIGGLLSQQIGGSALLIASGVVLVVVGVCVMLPIEDAAREAGTRRRL